MAGAEYDEKRGPNMGSRTTVRHGAQGAASSGALALVLQALVDRGTLSIQDAFVALAFLTPVLTTVWKLWDGLDGMARLKALLNRKLPLAILLLPFLGGCAIQLGTMEPKQFSTLDGGTLIACDTKGITLAFGDADLCSNSARGGHVSKTFSAMTLGVVRTVGAAVAGFFGGAGDGMARALEADRPVEVPVPPAAAPVEAPSPSATPPSFDVPTNPFTAPDPE